MATEKKNGITKVESPAATLRTMLEAAAPKLAAVAPKHLKVERLVRLLLAAGSRNPKILECDPQSVLAFAMKCSETGLEPIGAGGAWPIPYFNSKTQKLELQFLPDYRGLINAAKAADCITDAYAEVVRANDAFDYELGLEPKLTHKPARADRGDLENAYCVFRLPDGTKRFVVMDAEEIANIRSRSKAGQVGPWKSDEGEMWKKTVVRRAMKPFAGANAALDEAIAADDHATGIEFAAAARPAVAMPKAIEAKATVASEPETVPEETDDERAPFPADQYEVIEETTEATPDPEAKPEKPAGHHPEVIACQECGAAAKLEEKISKKTQKPSTTYFCDKRLGGCGKITFPKDVPVNA